MPIVLKEHDYAEQAIEQKTLGKKPSETLRRVARYYIDVDNITDKTAVRSRLEYFLLQCDHSASIPKWSKTLDFATDWAFKHEAINIEALVVSEPELARIDSLDGKQLRRLAFTLLCLSKYWNAVNMQNDSWVNSKDNEIMAFANINTSIRRQSSMYAALREAGLIQFSKKVDNTNVRVCFVENGITAVTITDLRNLGYQYLMYHGEPYFECANCGIVTRYKSPSNKKSTWQQKYCKSCAVEVSTRQSVNSVMSRKNTHLSSDTSRSNFIVYMHESPNDKKYIGVTRTALHQRWQNGIGYRCNQIFYSDIKQYGWDNIKHYVLLDTPNESDARRAESYLIQKYKTYKTENGYNRQLSHAGDYHNQNAFFELMPIEVDGMGRP